MPLLRRRAMMAMQTEGSIVYFRSGDVGWREGTVTSAPKPFNGRYTSDAILLDYPDGASAILANAVPKDGYAVNTPRWNAYSADDNALLHDCAENPHIFQKVFGMAWTRFRQLDATMIDRIELSDSAGNLLKTYKAQYVE